MSRIIRMLICLLAAQSSMLAFSQSNIISNGGFEGYLPTGYFPVYGQEFSLNRAPAWIEYTGDGDIRWFYDSLWAPSYLYEPNPSYQNGHFNPSPFNSAMPWDMGVPYDTMFLLLAQEGNFYIGFDAKSDGFDREGVQTHIAPCGLNSGNYEVSLIYSMAYGDDVDPHFFLSLSDQLDSRRHILDEVTVISTQSLRGQWYPYSKTFSLDVNTPDHMDNDWFAITGQQLGNSDPTHYLYFDDVRLYRPCDDLLRCNRTHGQICPTIATMLPPDDLLAVRDIDNVRDVHLVISNTLQQSLLDTTWHNANGFTEFRLARTNLPAQMATGNYPYTLTLSNDCGATKHAGTIRVADTALYNLTLPWTDSTANWSPTPIPCCLDSLLLRNLTLRGNVSYIVRDQITVQSGVSIAPGSNVILQAGNVTEIDSAEFDGSVSSLEILEIPCPQRCAQGQDCGGGLATIDVGGFVTHELDSVSVVSSSPKMPLGQGSKPATVSEIDAPDQLRISISPNPARDEAEIIVFLPTQTTATLAIYDIHQRLVRSLFIEELLPSGRHCFRTPLTDLPQGIYFVQLRAIDGVTQTRLVKQ